MYPGLLCCIMCNVVLYFMSVCATEKLQLKVGPGACHDLMNSVICVNVFPKQIVSSISMSNSGDKLSRGQQLIVSNMGH